jgi:hypothetical protein
MHDGHVVSHPSFASQPVRRGARRGRYPKKVVKIDEARERRLHVIEDGRLRAWARCAGEDASMHLDVLREKKRRSDAMYRVGRSRDADLYRSLDDLGSTAASIVLEVARLREQLIDRYKADVV